MINKSLFKSDAWFFAMGPSEFISGPVSELESVDESKLQELIVFDNDHEIKKVRGSLCGDFNERDSLNIDFDNKRKIVQYLDIEKTDDEPGYVWAIGGGRYRLPFPTPERIELEHYYKEDYAGIYHSVDFRVVRFLRNGEK